MATSATQPPPGRPRSAAWRWTGRIGLAVGSVGVAHALALSSRVLAEQTIDVLLLAAVTLVGMYGGRGAALLATALASWDMAYTFIPPTHSMAIQVDGLIWLGVFLAAAVLTSSLQARRAEAEAGLRVARDELEVRVRQRTADLARSQEQLNLLVNGTADQAVVMLTSAGDVASWNVGAERLLGYAAADVIGRPAGRLRPAGGGGLPPGLLAADRRAEQGWIVRGDGSRFWAALALSPIQDAAGHPRGYALAVRDLTERRTLERDLLEISDRERERIGHDLHDGLGQELTGIALLTTALSDRLAAAGVPQATDAEHVAELVHEAIGRTREMARGLGPLDVDGAELPAALAALVERVGRLPGPRPTFACGGWDGPTVNGPVAAHLYRIAQEAVGNAVRHGRADRVDVRLSRSDHRVTLTIANDGVPFPPAAQTQDPETGGIGLRLMAYRAAMIRGTLDVGRGTDGTGTVVRCEVADPSSGDGGRDDPRSNGNP